ncbi:MAG: hypothetical protein JKY33_10240 [Bacteroidia bacterium]|nr:hypothetical protein [Bacteroidia bacterium]
MKQLLTISLLLSFAIVFAQQEATTKDGKKVLLNEDGTWKYASKKQKKKKKKDEIDFCKFKTNEIDEFTGKSNKYLSTVALCLITWNRVKANLAKMDGQYQLYLRYDSPLGCVSGDSYAILKFEDESTIRLNHAGDIDCGSYPTFIAIIDDDIEKLKSNKVIRLRLTYESHEDFDVDQPDYFIESIKCLDEN